MYTHKSIWNPDQLNDNIFKEFLQPVNLDLFYLVPFTTDSIKINRPGHSIRMYWTNFWRPTIHVQQKVFEKPYIVHCITHLYTSFGTFCTQIGQLFETLWVFEACLEIHKLLSSKGNDVDFGILPRLIDQLGRKRCQKKRKDVEYKLLKKFNSKVFCYT